MYSDQGQLLKETISGQVVYEQDLDSQGRVTHVIDTTRDLEVKTVYETDGSQNNEVFQQGKLFITERIDRNNKLTSITEGNQ
jgi:YD repeat-containing protein